jgi:hypothetical protein
MTGRRSAARLHVAKREVEETLRRLPGGHGHPRVADRRDRRLTDGRGRLDCFEIVIRRRQVYRPGAHDPRQMGMSRKPVGKSGALGVLDREDDLEMGNAGGRGFRSGHLAQSFPQPRAIAFAVDSTAKFAIAKDSKRSDLFAAIKAAHSCLVPRFWIYYYANYNVRFFTCDLLVFGGCPIHSDSYLKLTGPVEATLER